MAIEWSAAAAREDRTIPDRIGSDRIRDRDAVNPAAAVESDAICSAGEITAACTHQKNFCPIRFARKDRAYPLLLT